MANDGAMLDVVMPAKGDVPWLTEALESLAAQTRPADTVWLVDDGLADPAAVERLGAACLGGAFRLVANEGRGISSALNTAIALSRARWIARMDSDDVALPARFARQLDYLEGAPPEVLGCGTQVYLVSGKDRRLGRSNYPLSGDGLREEMLRHTCFAHPSLVLMREALLHTPYRPALDGAEDVDLVLRLVEKGSLVNLDLPLLEYRIQTGQDNFVGRARQTAVQELAFRLADARHVDAVDPLDSDAGLADAFINWRLDQPGYKAARQAMTALRYLASFSRGGELLSALTCFGVLLRCTPWQPRVFGWIQRVLRAGPAGLRLEVSPFVPLNRATCRGESDA